MRELSPLAPLQVNQADNNLTLELIIVPSADSKIIFHRPLVIAILGMYIILLLKRSKGTELRAVPDVSCWPCLLSSRHIKYLAEWGQKAQGPSMSKMVSPSSFDEVKHKKGLSLGEFDHLPETMPLVQLEPLQSGLLGGKNKGCESNAFMQFMHSRRGPWAMDTGGTEQLSTPPLEDYASMMATAVDLGIVEWSDLANVSHSSFRRLAKGESVSDSDRKPRDKWNSFPEFSFYQRHCTTDLSSHLCQLL